MDPGGRRRLLPGLSTVFLLGRPARAALRKIRRHSGSGGPVFSLVEERSPEDVMSRVLASAPGEPVVVGLGNIVGPGERLVRYWEERGAAHDR